MTEVRAKKFLGQHFLTDESIARRIVESIAPDSRHLLEIGPGMGVLTKYLINRENTNFHVIEIDHESVNYLHNHYPTLNVIEGDFLKYDLSNLFQDRQYAVGFASRAGGHPFCHLFLKHSHHFVHFITVVKNFKKYL